MTVLQWWPFHVNAPLDNAKLCEPIEAYSSIAISGLSYFIACTATAGGHHAFACLTRAFEIEEWFSRLTPKVVALLHVSRQNLGFSAWEVTPTEIIPILKQHIIWQLQACMCNGVIGDIISKKYCQTEHYVKNGYIYMVHMRILCWYVRTCSKELLCKQLS